MGRSTISRLCPKVVPMGSLQLIIPFLFTVHSLNLSKTSLILDTQLSPLVRLNFSVGPG